MQEYGAAGGAVGHANIHVLYGMSIVCELFLEHTAPDRAAQTARQQC